MKKSAVDIAYEWTRQRILGGVFASGSLINEATICDGAGVSRTPAREALHRLKGEGLIVLVPRKGAQVLEPTSNDLFEAQDARMMVEQHAISNFCALRLEVPDVMRSMLVEMDLAAERERAEGIIAYQAADRAFHAALVATLENRPIGDFFESLWRVNRWGTLTRKKWLSTPAFVECNRAQHRDLVAALEQHDEERSTAIIAQHLGVTPE